MPGNVFIIKAHEQYPFSEGKLNAALVDRAVATLSDKGYTVRTTTMRDKYDAAAEIEKHPWADSILVQSPCNWMGVPWSFNLNGAVSFQPSASSGAKSAPCRIFCPISRSPVG